MQLTSNAFLANSTIPDQYTCTSAGSSPPLHISGIPGTAQTLALIMHDPDAPRGDFTHWTLWNIPASTDDISENTTPQEATIGLNDFGDAGYGHPCPPSGTHRYIFELYALDSHLDIPRGSSRRQLEDAMQDHIVGKAQLIGLVSA